MEKKNTICPEEFLVICQRILHEDCDDHEAIHSGTDNLMESILIDLGYGEGIELIRNSTRWYA